MLSRMNIFLTFFYKNAEFHTRNYLPIASLFIQIEFSYFILKNRLRILIKLPEII